jgi:hypothetical protein
MQVDTPFMSESIEPPANPPTPWEFLPEDEQLGEPEPPTEEAAMHVETVDDSGADDNELNVVVHYLEDEQPEIPDRSVPDEPSDVTPDVEDLLIRQHYLPPTD